MLNDSNAVCQGHLGKPGKDGKAGLKGAKVRVRLNSLNYNICAHTASDGHFGL